jgi:phosphoglycerol transferase MdoB-like AlkP superfamily enzyme
MLNGIKTLLKYFTYWLLFFAFSRILFYAWHWEKTAQLQWKTVLRSFYEALPVDISAASYLTILPVLLLLFAGFFPFQQQGRVLKIYTLALLSIISLLNIADLQLYGEWGSRLNAQAISFMRYPNEVIASASSSPLLLLLFMFALQLLLGLLLYRLMFAKSAYNAQANLKEKFSAAGLYLLAIALLIVGIRGGLQLIPINQSAVYFSEFPFANHASVNTAWNLMYSLANTGSKVKIDNYRFMPPEQAEEIVSRLYEKNKNCEPVSLVNPARPNVVIIILESWTAEVIESLGGEKNITGEFNKLTAEGILFRQLYSSGDRTDKGLVAILSGFPSQPTSSVITEPDKVNKLPQLNRYFKNEGYRTSFYYGGESEFANMKAYLLNMGFDRITDKDAFEAADQNSKWGTHDHVVFNRALQELEFEQQPFFSTIMTLSSHEPFEVPVAPVFPGSDEATLFRNAVHYTDQSLGHFFREAKKQPWYQNTLFVLVADHGHRLPGNLDLHDPRRFRIPLLFTGGALKNIFHNTRVEKTGSQTDIPATLLSMLSEKSNDFKWSRNLLCDSTGNFAFFSFNDGFGWMEDGNAVVFDNISKSTLHKSGTASADTSLQKGKAYLQHLMEQYLK